MGTNNWGYGEESSGGGGMLTYPDTGAANAIAINTAAVVLVIGEIFTVTNIVANNTGATTISINSATPIEIVGMGTSNLQGGEIVTGCDLALLINSVGTVTLISTSNGSLPVKTATQSNQAVTLEQLNTDQLLDLKTANNLSEIATAGSAAQLAARNNLAIPVPATFLQTSNDLSEIAAQGSTAQSNARTNLGVNTSNFLQTANNLSEIATAGPTAQTAARTNIGAQQSGTSLQTANNLSEIATAGSTAQSAARTNLGVDTTQFLLKTNNLSEIATAGTSAQSAARTNIGAQQNGISLITSNLLSEISALGSTAQATAQSNLGISGGGSSIGRFLGTLLLTSSGTYTLATGCRLIIAEMTSGGSGSGGIPGTSSTQWGISAPGFPGSWMIIQFLVSQLSTSGTNQISVTIGSAGVGTTTTGGTSGATLIDAGSVAACPGVTGGPVGSAITTTASLVLPRAYPSVALSIISPAVLIASKTQDHILSISPLYGSIAGNPLPYSSTSASNSVGISYFSEGVYGQAAPGGFNASSSALRSGASGSQGAVRLWMYS
jgi:hypothetical protein